MGIKHSVVKLEAKFAIKKPAINAGFLMFSTDKIIMQ